MKPSHERKSFLGYANYYREFIKGDADKIYPMQQLMRNKSKKVTWTDEAQVSFENIKRELCEAPVLGMPTEKKMFVLDTDASVVSISGIFHQEQEWNGRTVPRPIAYGSKVLSCVMAKKTNERDSARKIFDILLNRFGYGVQGHQAMVKFEKRRQGDDKSIDKFLDDLELLRRRSNPDERISERNLVNLSDVLRMKPREYLLINPRAQNCYCNYGN